MVPVATPSNLVGTTFWEEDDEGTSKAIGSGGSGAAIDGRTDSGTKAVETAPLARG